MSVYTSSADELSNRLRAGLAGLFAVSDTTTAVVSQRETVRFRGRFLVPAEQAYERIRAHFSTLGYTPLFRREADAEVVIAGPGTIDVRPSRVWINVVLFALTVLSVIGVGMLYLPRDYVPPSDGLTADYLDRLLTGGLPYGIPLMIILLCHEFGHYLAARYHGVAVSLPYFIPLPLPPLGTMGAAIVQKEPFRNRKILFDVGVAGPLAGLIVALPILIYGLSLSHVKPPWPVAGQSLQEGNSLLYLGLKYLIFGRILPGNFVDVDLNPIAFAGWVGLLVTSLNLLPAGQLDGGHVAYVLFGERTRQISQAVMIILGLFGALPFVLGALGLPVIGWEGWLLWAGLIFVFGRWHPPALDEVTALDPRRRALAWAMVVIFILVFIPIPLRQF